MPRIVSLCAALGAVFVPLANSLATYSPGPSYSIAIPTGSSISQTSTGSLYIQISAPTTYQWVGFGIGKQMQGATIFLIYSDGNGNVTASIRDGGQGHTEPLLSSKQSGLTLLAGSGIVGSKMIANLLCTTCTLLSASTSKSSPFIGAWSQGSAIDSTDTSYNINQHPQSNTRQFTLDLTAAAISSDSNPFTTDSSSGSATPTGGATATGDATTTGTGSSPSSTSGSDSNNGVTVVGSSPTKIANFDKAHGIIMGLVVTLLFPLGAISMRVGGNMDAHRVVQMVSLVALIVGFGLGIKLAQMRDYLFKGTATAHTVFGTVIVALFLLQPVFGFLHHANYLKYNSRTTVSHVHIWYGRLIMILAVINGGLGLKLAANSKGGKIAYAVVAGVMGSGYILATVLKRKAGTGSGNERANSMLRGANSDKVGSEESQPVVLPHYK